MLISEFLAQYPEAKENPDKYIVEHLMRVKRWALDSDTNFLQTSILLQDFCEERDYLIEEIKKFK